MKTKNLFFIFLVALFTLQPIIAQTDKSRIKKETLFKALKIAGYSAELFSAVFSYSAFQYYFWDRSIDNLTDPTSVIPLPTLKAIKGFAQDKNGTAAISCSIFQVPFFASAIHALHGLYTTVKSS